MLALDLATSEICHTAAPRDSAEVLTHHGGHWCTATTAGIISMLSVKKSPLRLEGEKNSDFPISCSAVVVPNAVLVDVGDMVNMAEREQEEKTANDVEEKGRRRWGREEHEKG